jgi:hypothetical protein
MVTVELAMKISINCDRNLRRALLMLESTKMQYNTNNLNKDMTFQLPDWEIFIQRYVYD